MRQRWPIIHRSRWKSVSGVCKHAKGKPAQYCRFMLDFLWLVQVHCRIVFYISLPIVTFDHQTHKKRRVWKVDTSSMKLLLRHQGDLSLLGNLGVRVGHLCQRVPGVQGLPKQIIPHVCTTVSENHHGWYLQHKTQSKFGIITQKLISAGSMIVHPCIYLSFIHPFIQPCIYPSFTHPSIIISQVASNPVLPVQKSYLKFLFSYEHFTPNNVSGWSIILLVLHIPSGREGDSLQSQPFKLKEVKQHKAICREFCMLSRKNIRDQIVGSSSS